MKIGGFQKNSLIDYPNLISAVVFTYGCNFRCPFCHNAELVVRRPERFYSEDEILGFLKTRINKLDAVSITGGEPTLHKDLPEFIAKLKKMGFKVKIDTNGTNPKMVEFLLKRNLIDFIAMDVKTLPDRKAYSSVVGIALSDEMFSNILRTIEIIKNSKIKHEFRTTAIKEIHNKDKLNGILKAIKGADKFVLQEFNPENTLNPEWHKMKPLNKDEICPLNREHVKSIEFR